VTSPRHRRTRKAVELTLDAATHEALEYLAEHYVSKSAAVDQAIQALAKRKGWDPPERPEDDEITDPESFVGTIRTTRS